MKIVDKIRNKLKLVLTLKRSPRVLAVSSALGVLIGMSPYVGTHTYLALLVSGWFNLPIYPLMIGAYITNPFTIPFIYGITTKVGMIVLGRTLSINFDWSSISFHTLLEAGKTLFLPFIVGTHICGLILAMITYPLVYFIAKRYSGSEDRLVK